MTKSSHTVYVDDDVWRVVKEEFDGPTSQVVEKALRAYIAGNGDPANGYEDPGMVANRLTIELLHNVKRLQSVTEELADDDD